ncbi:MAG: A/G-specific adenine glycosylase [Planctomycetes bacterium]|nr:A/G-specific adenine glycosylase [Planctomycetota bacterium]
MTTSDFATRLLAWYRRHARRLPWRSRRDPWATWVSEVMLQQTRVEVVIPAFERFLARFPNPRAFASASDDELQEAWRGLGYYRRARLLREGAAEVVARHRGRVPSDPDALGALAGVGDYTRVAIASIAFGHAEPAIDGNVERVFARHAGITANVKSSATRNRLATLVGERMPKARAGDFNQALMDLGAMVCTPRAPKCLVCPVAGDCEARRLGLQQELPRLPARKPSVAILARAVLVRRKDGAVLGARIRDGEINAGQIELPGPGILADHQDAGDALAHALHARYGARFEIGEPVARVRHGITHHRIALEVHDAKLLGRAGGRLRWYPTDDPAVPWSTPSRKALSAHARRGAR